MPGVGLKKKGEDEVSVYYNMAHEQFITTMNSLAKPSQRKWKAELALNTRLVFYLYSDKVQQSSIWWYRFLNYDNPPGRLCLWLIITLIAFRLYGIFVVCRMLKKWRFLTNTFTRYL